MVKHWYYFATQFISSLLAISSHTSKQTTNTAEIMAHFRVSPGELGELGQYSRVCSGITSAILACAAHFREVIICAVFW